MLKSCVSFFKNNGIFGYGLKFLPRVLSLRGGDKSMVIMALAEQRLNDELQAIMADSDLTQKQKQKLMQEITDNILDNSLKNPASWKTGNYRKGLQLASKHPVYSQLKKKSPFVIMSFPMFQELKRGALARAIGQGTIPLQLTTYFGISMPIVISASIIEMVVPYKSVKIGCRVTKQVVGAPFFVCCLTIDRITKPFEKIGFGEPIPIDANNLMGTMPTQSDIAMLDEITGLKKQAQYAGNVESLSKKTLADYEELLEKEVRDMVSSAESTRTDFEKAIGISSAGDNDICQPPTYNPGATLGP